MKPPYLSVIFYLYAKSETSTSNTLKALFDDKTPDQSYKILEKGNMGCQVSKGDIKSDNFHYNSWVAGTIISLTKHLKYYFFFIISCNFLCKNPFNLFFL